MSVDIILLDAAAVSVIDGAPVTVVGAGIDILTDLEGPQGPSGRDAFVGAFFSWAGPILAGEPPLSQVMPVAGVFDPTNCRGGAALPPAADAVFTLSIDGVGAGAVTFPAGQTAPVFSFSSPAYAAGAYVAAAPPTLGDPALSGPAFVLSN